MPDRCREHCTTCPKADGSRYCSCSRAASARVARFVWDALRSRARRVKREEWAALALAIIATATAAWSAK